MLCAASGPGLHFPATIAAGSGCPSERCGPLCESAGGPEIESPARPAGMLGPRPRPTTRRELPTRSEEAVRSPGRAREGACRRVCEQSGTGGDRV